MAIFDLEQILNKENDPEKRSEILVKISLINRKRSFGKSALRSNLINAGASSEVQFEVP